jgi:hypothetical protein
MYIRASRRRFIPLDPSTPLDLYFIYAYYSHLQITIYAYCLCDLRYTTQLYLIYGHVLYGTPAFIQQSGMQKTREGAQTYFHGPWECICIVLIESLERKSRVFRCPVFEVPVALFCTYPVFAILYKYNNRCFKNIYLPSPPLWLGWPYLRTKAQGPWHKGACFNFLPSFGGAFYTKSARRSRQVPGGQFPNRLEVIHKNVSDWFYK